MPSSHDLQIIRQIQPTTFAVDSGYVVCRGLRELRPRRLHIAKAAATLIRQVASPGTDVPAAAIAKPAPPYVQDALLMASTSEGELEPLFGYLGDFSSLSISINMLPVLLQSLRHLDRPTIVAALGEGKVALADAHTNFARSLGNFNRQAEEEILQRLAGQAQAIQNLRAEAAGARHDVLTLQEKPGRSFPLHLWEPTLKTVVKRWQTLSQERDSQRNSAVMPCFDGWGLGALVLRPNGESRRSFRLASIELRLPAQRFDLNTISLLAQVADTWLQELNVASLQDMQRITLSIPSPIITAYVQQGLNEYTRGKLTDQHFVFPDLLWGWQPVLTFIECLTRSELPSLFINTGRFPLVNVVALWPVV